jgi:hypothetical protein
MKAGLLLGLFGKRNRGRDLDRETYGSAPSWNECIRILGNSLVQLPRDPMEAECVS